MRLLGVPDMHGVESGWGAGTPPDLQARMWHRAGSGGKQAGTTPDIDGSHSDGACLQEPGSYGEGTAREQQGDCSGRQVMENTVMLTHRSSAPPCQRSKACPGAAYLLGLLAMIKCSICSYQCDN